MLLAAMAKNSSRRTPRAYALARCEAHAPRWGGRMRNDAARDSVPSYGRVHVGARCGVDARIAPPFMEATNRCESTGVCRRGFVSRILTHSLDKQIARA